MGSACSADHNGPSPDVSNKSRDRILAPPCEFAPQQHLSDEVVPLQEPSATAQSARPVQNALRVLHREDSNDQRRAMTQDEWRRLQRDSAENLAARQASKIVGVFPNNNTAANEATIGLLRPASKPPHHNDSCLSNAQLSNKTTCDTRTPTSYQEQLQPHQHHSVDGATGCSTVQEYCRLEPNNIVGRRRAARNVRTIGTAITSPSSDSPPGAQLQVQVHSGDNVGGGTRRPTMLVFTFPVLDDPASLYHQHAALSPLVPIARQHAAASTSSEHALLQMIRGDDDPPHHANDAFGRVKLQHRGRVLVPMTHSPSEGDSSPLHHKGGRGFCGSGSRHSTRQSSLCSEDIVDTATGAMYFQSPGTTPVVGALYNFTLPNFRDHPQTL
jgi:hypothetical protein